MSMVDVYGRALIEHFGFSDDDDRWVTNWPPVARLDLAEVGRVSRGGFVFGGTLAEHGIPYTVETVDPSQPVPEAKWDFTSSNSISISIKADASLPAWAKVVNAKASLECSFGKDSGVVISAEQLLIERLTNQDALKRAMIEAYRRKVLSIGSAVPVERMRCSKAVVMGSEGSSGSLKVASSAGIQAGASPVSFAASFDIVEKSSTVTAFGLANGCTFGARVLVIVKTGILWWRHIVVRGITQPTDADYLSLLEMQASDSDYFAKFD
jgi:hypothetical protein